MSIQVYFGCLNFEGVLVSETEKLCHPISAPHILLKVGISDFLTEKEKAFVNVHLSNILLDFKLRFVGTAWNTPHKFFLKPAYFQQNLPVIPMPGW